MLEPRLTRVLVTPSIQYWITAARENGGNVSFFDEGIFLPLKSTKSFSLDITGSMSMTIADIWIHWLKTFHKTTGREIISFRYIYDFWFDFPAVRFSCFNPFHALNLSTNPYLCCFSICTWSGACSFHWDPNHGKRLMYVGGSSKFINDHVFQIKLKIFIGANWITRHEAQTFKQNVYFRKVSPSTPDRLLACRSTNDENIFLYIWWY